MVLFEILDYLQSKEMFVNANGLVMVVLKRRFQERIEGSERIRFEE